MHSKWNCLNNDGRYLYVLGHALGCGDAGPTLAQVCSPEARAFAETYILDFRGKPKSRNGTIATRYFTASMLPRRLYRMWEALPEASRTDPLYPEVVEWQTRSDELKAVARAEQKYNPPKNNAAPAALNGDAKRKACADGAVNPGRAAEIAAAFELLHLIVANEDEDEEGKEITAGQRYEVLVNTEVARIGPSAPLPKGIRPNQYHPTTRAESAPPAISTTPSPSPPPTAP